MAVFFVSCQIGLEKDLQQEIEIFWHNLIDLDGLPTRSRPEFVEDEILGGVEINCETYLGYQINLFSKLANRVLLRIHHFPVRFFDQFEKELKKMDFSKYFGNDKFNISIDASKSRLFHENNLMEAANKVLKNSLIKKQENHCTVYIRIHKDKAVISLDTSGEHLHKRGYRQFQGAAPIRETLAAKTYNFLLQAGLNNEIDFSENSSKTIVLDPFCGSGTMLFEAASFHLPNLEQFYDFEKFQNREALFKSSVWKKNYKIESKNMNQFLGFELDIETFEKTQKNFEIFKTYYPSFDSKNMKFENKNSVDIQKQDLPINSESIFILTNPPYGERLSSNQALDVLYKIESSLDLKGIVMIHPESWNIKFKKLNFKRAINFNNQGLKLKLSLFS